MMQLFSMIFSIFLMINWSAASPSTGSSDSVDDQAIPSVSYCGILKDPKAYTGKLVRIKAVWQFGFEITSLYDRKCREKPQAWLEFADEKHLCPETNRNLSIPGRSDKEAEVTVTGRLYGPGRYGHLGGYQFKFVVVCLEKVKVISSDSISEND